MNLFKRNAQQTSKQDKQAAQHGYKSDYMHKMVMLFQQTIEREIAKLPVSEQADAYEGLRLALLKARSDDFYMIGYEQDDMMRLRSIFNQVTFASAELAYTAR